MIKTLISFTALIVVMLCNYGCTISVQNVVYAEIIAAPAEASLVAIITGDANGAAFVSAVTAGSACAAPIAKSTESTAQMGIDIGKCYASAVAASTLLSPTDRVLFTAVITLISEIEGAFSSNAKTVKLTTSQGKVAKKLMDDATKYYGKPWSTVTPDDVARKAYNLK